MPEGELVPWESPEGLAMEIAAAAPQWPWTDLSYALAPNGRNLDYVTNSPYKGPSRQIPDRGLESQLERRTSTKSGKRLSNYNPNESGGQHPRLASSGWKPASPTPTRASTGSSNCSRPSIRRSASTPRSSPSPSLIQSGWNDDLFPVDEALRYYQRTRAQYPGDPISLYLADIGHARSQNKEADVAAFNARLEAWFAHYLKGEGAAPTSSVEALTTTCPKSTPSEGPFKAGRLGRSRSRARSASSRPGRRRSNHGTFEEEKAAEPTSSGAFDPIVGPTGKTPARRCRPRRSKMPAPSNYSLGAGARRRLHPDGIADDHRRTSNPRARTRRSPRASSTSRRKGPRASSPAASTGRTVATRKWCSSCTRRPTTSPKGTWRSWNCCRTISPTAASPTCRRNVTVSDLELRLPVTGAAGCARRPGPDAGAEGRPGRLHAGGEFETEQSAAVAEAEAAVAEPRQPEAVPGSGSGARSAPAASAGKLSANRKVVIVPVRCTGEGACSGQVSISVKQPGKKGRTALAKGTYSIAPGATAKVRLPLTKAGRKIVKSNLASGRLAELAQRRQPCRHRADDEPDLETRGPRCRGGN